VVLIGLVGAFIVVKPHFATPDNAITRENARPGTQSWQIGPGQEAITEVQGYASATSVSPGDKLTLHVSTANAGDPYTISIYRLGWYNGDGARLMAPEISLRGQAQGSYNFITRALTGCGSCRIDKNTGLVDAGWQPSYTFTIPDDWTTGIYLAKFTHTASGKSRYTPFDVRGNAHSAYVAVTSDNTYQAYNLWGGNSLYDSDDDAPTMESPPRGVMISFNRPYLTGKGASDVLLYEISALRWMEKQGYDLSYISSLDMHRDSDQLLDHRAYLSLGHDEYWSKEMRDGAEKARDRGVGIVFFGADAAYWQIRYQPDFAGVPDRTIVSYKVKTSDNDLARDPDYGVDNSLVTSQWRDPVLNRPENSLIGIMYSDLTLKRFGYPWQMGSRASSPLLDGTGLRANQEYGCNLVGYEWDKVWDNDATPPNLQIISTSQTRNDDGVPDTSNTTYYIARSGAMVFATGSVYWTLSLDSYRFRRDQNEACADKTAVIPEMQNLMTNVMRDVVVLHPSGQL
jgi:hypothetical protein